MKTTCALCGENRGPDVLPNSSCPANHVAPVTPPTGKREVYAVTERDGRTFWTKVGTAHDNRDGSITLKLEALPLSGNLNVRDGGGTTYWNDNDTSAPDTPWGPAQQRTIIAPGIANYETAEHGGIKLDAKHNKQVHPAWRSPDGWYEEDCQWAIVALTFPEVYTAPNVRDGAKRTAEAYYPACMREVFPMSCATPEESA